MDGLEWQCPSCTLLNKAVSFKCMICGTPKGTSTRQAKYHSAAIEKQYVAESLTKQQTPKHISKQGIVTQSTTPLHSSTSGQTSSISVQPNSTNAITNAIATTNIKSTASNDGTTHYRRKRNRSKGDKTVLSKYPTLTNIDRTTGRSYTITIDSVTVIITEYDFLYPPSD